MTAYRDTGIGASGTCSVPDRYRPFGVDESSSPREVVLLDPGVKEYEREGRDQLRVPAQVDAYSASKSIGVVPGRYRMFRDSSPVGRGHECTTTRG